MVKNTLTNEIDELDRLLINELEINSRQSTSDIARKVGAITNNHSPKAQPTF